MIWNRQPKTALSPQAVDEVDFVDQVGFALKVIGFLIHSVDKVHNVHSLRTRLKS